MSVSPTTAPPSPNGANGNGKVAPAPTPAEPAAACTCSHEPEVESVPLKNAPGRPPYWQSRPCPDWCSHQHRNADDDTDRDCYGVTNSMWLTSMTASSVETGREVAAIRDSDEWRVWPSDMHAWLRQGYREAEARVGMGYGPSVEFYLTLGEAAELRDLLTSLLEQARS